MLFYILLQLKLFSSTHAILKTELCAQYESQSIKNNVNKIFRPVQLIKDDQLRKTSKLTALFAFAIGNES